MLISKKLIELDKQGELDSVLTQFKKEINEKTFLGAGGDASAFLCKGGHQVIKICAKESKNNYFQNFSQKNGKIVTAKEFQKHVTKLQPFLLPIEEIVYDDENIWIYKQSFCRRFEKHKMDLKSLITIFEMVYHFLSQANIINSISAHNLGIFEGNNSDSVGLKGNNSDSVGLKGNNLVMFDYHGLHPVIWDKNEKWWEQTLRHLTEYISVLFAKHKRRQYEKRMRFLSSDLIKDFEKDGLLPIYFINFLKFCVDSTAEIPKDRFLKLLGQCILHLREEQ